MRVICRIELEYSSPEVADRIQRSVELDNDEHLKSSAEGRMLIAVAEAASLASLLHTLDDFLSCVSVAEQVSRDRN